MQEQVIKCVTESNTDWSNIIMAVASVVNLIIVIIIFKVEQKNNKIKEIKDEKKSWYDVLGVRTMTSEIFNSLNILKTKTMDFYAEEISQEEYLNCYKEIDIKLLKYKNEYLTIVECLNPELLDSLTLEFQNIQDEIYALMTYYVGDKNLNNTSNTQKINIDFDNVRKRILKMSIKII